MDEWIDTNVDIHLDKVTKLHIKFIHLAILDNGGNQHATHAHV